MSTEFLAQLLGRQRALQANRTYYLVSAIGIAHFVQSRLMRNRLQGLSRRTISSRTRALKRVELMQASSEAKFC